MTTTMHATRTSVFRSALQQGGRPPHLRLVRPGEPGVVLVSRSAVGAEPPLRLTRRGRAVLRALLVLALVGLMTAAALLMAHRADAADAPGPRVVVQHHVVLPGETLWGIATELAPGADPRDTIASIVEFNALQSSAVHAGQDLAIPPRLAHR
jgi:LysM domain-containing protein